MRTTRFLNILFMFMLIASLVLGVNKPGLAMPMDPTDETKVPHYFGPNPNWALSPLRQADVAVDLTGGGGTGAAAKQPLTPKRAPSPPSPSPVRAAATPLPRRSISQGWVTMPPQPRWLIIPALLPPSPWMWQAADTPLLPSTISGGGATTDATATVYGGVDAVAVTDPGLGYTFPTVEFGLPNDPNGVQATGHADHGCQRLHHSGDRG